MIITNNIAEQMASPEFLSFMLDNQDKVCILEDCEKVIQSRDTSNFTNAIANILNMSDGLLSDIFNIKFICTFNADITSIDDALTRKGRCYADYDFKPLSEEKTKVLLKERGFDVAHPGKMTLSDIYYYEKNDYDTSKKPKKAGF